VNAPKHVLVVEDESVLRASMIAGLAKLQGASVSGSATLQEAIAALDVAAPDVVVSDIDLPDGLGVALIGELAKRRLRAPVIFVTAYRAAYGSLIPPHASVEVLEKPISLDALRRVVAQRLGEEDAPPSPFVVADYVQLSCMGRHSVTIDVEWRDGAGAVEIVHGELWSATDPSGVGPQAFRRLAFRHDVRIRCAASDAPPGPRTIDLPWESVLMESARLDDEERRASRPAFDLGDVSAAPDDFGDIEESPTMASATPSSRVAPSRPSPEVHVVTEEDRFAALYDEAIAALMTKDYRRAARALGKARALRPDHAMVAANLARLHDMGFEPEE